MKHETLDTSFRLASPSCPLVFDAYADDFSAGAGGFYTVNLFVFFSEDNLVCMDHQQGEGIHELRPVSPVFAHGVVCAPTGCIL